MKRKIAQFILGWAAGFFILVVTLALYLYVTIAEWKDSV